MSKPLFRPALIVLAVMLAALCAAPTGAFASKYKGYEILPTPSPAVPQEFYSEYGLTQLQATLQNIHCEKGYATGSFTSAKKGTEVQRFTGCILVNNGLAVETPGAAAGELVTVTTPIESVWDKTTEGPAIVINPYSEPTKNALIPVIDMGTATAGPVTGGILWRVSSSVPKTTKFTLHANSGWGEDIYKNVNNVGSFAEADNWYNFKGNYEKLKLWTEKEEASLTFTHEVEFKFYEL